MSMEECYRVKCSERNVGRPCREVGDIKSTEAKASAWADEEGWYLHDDSDWVCPAHRGAWEGE